MGTLRRGRVQCVYRRYGSSALRDTFGSVDIPRRFGTKCILLHLLPLYDIFSGGLAGSLLLGGGQWGFHRRGYCLLLLPRPNETRGLYYSALRLRRLCGGLPNLAMPMRSLHNLPANRRIPGIFRNRRGFRGRCAVPAFGCIASLPNCPNTFPCKCPHISNGILCRPGYFFFRIIAGRIRPLRLPVRRLFRFAPDKVSLYCS